MRLVIALRQKSKRELRRLAKRLLLQEKYQEAEEVYAYIEKVYGVDSTKSEVQYE